MSDIRFVAPSTDGEFVALARSPQGRLYRKHILTKGDLIHPVTKKIIKIDDSFVSQLTSNFDSGVCPIVQIPLAGHDNEHSEAPDRNIGEVVGLEEHGNKVYAVLDIRKHQEDIGTTLLGASAMFSENYTDTRTGKKVGPTLLHTAVTNRPYLTDLDDYEEIFAASSDGNRENTVFLTVAPIEETQVMELGEITELLLEHGIDLVALQAKAAEADGAIQMSDQLKDALGVVKLSNGESVSGEDIVGSVVELAQINVSLSNRLEELEKDKAATEVDGLIAQGRMLPSVRDAMLEIRLSNPEQFAKLIPETPFIKLSVEQGISESEDTSTELDAHVERYAKMALANGYSR